MSICRRHDKATWNEQTDEWVCDKCGTRWAVRRNRLGEAIRRQSPPLEARGIVVPKPTMPDRWIG